MIHQEECVILVITVKLEIWEKLKTLENTGVDGSSILPHRPPKNGGGAARGGNGEINGIVPQDAILGTGGTTDIIRG